ncbi:MAG: 5-(carboxyamino)imidazole ribonucleotide mutase [Ferruginibacter sp.]
MNPLVSIIMGSESDLPAMQAACNILNEFDIAHEVRIISAHRTPDDMRSFALNARERGIQVIIAGAGGAAHLPGMVASYTTLPVIGVPVKSTQSMEGWDSVLSILQMPAGVPVATMALNNSKNAGILAAQILSLNNQSIQKQLEDYKKDMEKQVAEMNARLK